jgi:FKBP-type peptidyl-prolyl cis-trans isomerase
MTEEDKQKLEQWEKEGKIRVPEAVKKTQELKKKEENQKKEEVQEKKEVAKKKTPQKKKETEKKEKKPVAEKKREVVNMEGTLTTRDVAAMVGTTPKALRRVLRKNWYADGKFTNYRWTKDDPILQQILDYYKKAGKAEKA